MYRPGGQPQLIKEIFCVGCEHEHGQSEHRTSVTEDCHIVELVFVANLHLRWPPRRRVLLAVRACVSLKRGIVSDMARRRRETRQSPRRSSDAVLRADGRVERHDRLSVTVIPRIPGRVALCCASVSVFELSLDRPLRQPAERDEWEVFAEFVET